MDLAWKDSNYKSEEIIFWLIIIFHWIDFRLLVFRVQCATHKLYN